MSKILSLLLASAALTAGLGVPAWSAMHLPQQGEAVKTMTAVFGSTDTADLLVLVDDDDDDDEDEDGNKTRGASNDDDDDAEDCDDDDGSCGAVTANQAVPAGKVAPPQNGLFDTGTPQVQVK
jgi:hypothetical protein